MYILLGKPQSMLETKIGTMTFDTTIRNRIPVAVIDDEAFAYEALLRDHSYNIKRFNDIEDVRSLKAFPIILCDIKGVGKFFKSKFEGGHLIKEIRSYYPYKVIYAYSGHQLDPSFNQYFQMADRTLNGYLNWVVEETTSRSSCHWQPKYIKHRRYSRRN